MIVSRHLVGFTKSHSRRKHPDELELVELAGVVDTVDDLVDGI